MSPHRPSESLSGTAQKVGQGYVWASRIMGIALQGVIPTVIGVWCDRAWGTTPWLTIVGGLLGFGSFMVSIVRLSGSGSALARGHGSAKGAVHGPESRAGDDAGVDHSPQCR